MGQKGIGEENRNPVVEVSPPPASVQTLFLNYIGTLLTYLVVTGVVVVGYHLFVVRPALELSKVKIVAVDTVGYSLALTEELSKGKITQEEYLKRIAAFRNRIDQKYPGYQVFEAGAVVAGIPEDEELGKK